MSTRTICGAMVFWAAVTALGYTTPDVRYVREFGAVGDNLTDDTGHLQNALSPSLNGNAKIIDGEHLACRITGSLTVPAGVTLRNISLQLATAGMNGVLMNTGSQLEDVGIAGTGSQTAVTASAAASDVKLLNVDIAKVNYGLWLDGTFTRWEFDVYVHSLVGGVKDTNYGVRLGGAVTSCWGTIRGKDLNNVALNLTGGPAFNHFTVDAEACGEAAVNVDSEPAWSDTRFNKIVAFAKDCALGLRCRKNANFNDFQVFVNNTTSQAQAVTISEAGGPSPKGNAVHNSMIQGTFTGSDILSSMDAENTRIVDNTIYGSAGWSILASRREGTNPAAWGDWIEGNILNGQAANVIGIYAEVNTVPSYVGSNLILNNGTGVKVNDTNTEGKRRGWSKEYTGAILGQSISAGGTVSLPVTLPSSVSAAKVMASIVAAGTGSSKCSYRIENFNSTSCSGFTIVVSSTDTSTRTVDVHWRVCGD